MTALLNAELIKLRTTRTFIALAGTALALSLLIVGLVASLGDDFTQRDVDELFAFDSTSFFILLLGVIGMAGEWRHRTITATVLAAPDRLRLLAAKTLSYAIAGAVVSLVVSLAIMVVGTVILSGRGMPTADSLQLADVLWRNVLVAALLGAFGVCIGALVRNQFVAVIGLLVYLFVIESVVATFADEVVRFSPTAAASGIAQTSSEISDLLSPGVALLVMLAWIGAGFAAAAWLLRRRDLI